MTLTDARGERLRGLRHDIRTPIGHILGYADLVLEQIAEIPPQQLPDGQAHTGDRAIARGAEHDDFMGMLRKIRAAAQELLEAVDRRVQPEQLFATPVDLEALQHDLRTPLNAVVGYSELLEEDALGLGLDAVIPDLRRIHDAGRGLVGLIDAVLELATADTRYALRSVRLPPLAPSKGAPQPTPKGTILVIDDDATNRDLLGRSLRRAGHEVVEAESGPQALAKLRTARVDLVLLDVSMPGMDGHDVCRRIRTDERTRALPVIMVTASESSDKVRGIDAGADDFMPKPFDQPELLARVRSLLRVKAYHDKIEAQAIELAEWKALLEERVRTQVEELDRMGRLRRFLSPQVSELVVSSGGEALLEGHRREVTVLFCDLRGFTRLAETATADEVIGVLREYYAAVGDLAFTFQGTIEHFEGDGVMVFFNDPIPVADHILNAVRMAVGVRERMDALTTSWRARRHEVGYGMGIAVGDATLGRIGFEGRWDYAAIGSVTNLAARLCAQARSRQILVDDRVKEMLGAFISTTAVGALELKGFAGPVQAYDVVTVR